MTFEIFEWANVDRIGHVVRIILAMVPATTPPQLTPDARGRIGNATLTRPFDLPG